VRLLALGGVAGPLVFAFAVVITASRQPGYSHVAQFVSALGATGSPQAAIMNYGGFVPAGLLLAGFGLALRRALWPDPVAGHATAVVLFFGLAVGSSGLVSCDPGCPLDSGSLENLIHNAMAPIVFFATLLAITALGARFRRLAAWRRLSLFSLATGGAGLVFFAGLLSSLDARTTTGLWQRLLLATLFSWCAITGLHVYRQRETVARAR
jgi:hypothetical membrane protein